MPPQRRSKPRSAEHAALAKAIELYIAEDPDMTQESVAFDGNLTPKQVSALVCGRSNPTYTTLLKLARGLHVKLGELMVRADDLRERRARR